jgi:hypothetical protein
MKLKTAVLLTILGVSAGALIAVGCAQLDKLEPQYAGHPAILAPTTGPMTGPAASQPAVLAPATKSDSVAQVADLAAKTGATISAVPVPYASLIGGLLYAMGTTVLAVDQAIRRKGHASRADAYADALTQFANGAPGVAGAVSQLNPQAGAAVAEAGKVAGAVAGAIKTP